MILICSIDKCSKFILVLLIVNSDIMHNMSLVVRKAVFGVFDMVPHKPVCTATEDG